MAANSSLAQQILELLEENPGQKARSLSGQLEVDKSEINSLLYGALRGKVVQDKAYRWWLKGTKEVELRKPSQQKKLDTPLSRLCGYYLDCLNHDDQGGVSVFASSYNDLDYAELMTLPAVSDDPDEVFEDEAVRRLLGKSRRDRGRLTLVLGYPVRLNRIRSKKGWEGLLVEPIFLFAYQENPTNRHAVPSLVDELPQINYKALRSLTTADSVSIVEEVIQLSVELGLADAEAELPDVDEVIPRLRSIRPEWDWKEEPNPYNLGHTPALSEISEAGIYNRAAIISAERSPYTKGLETELTLLQSVPPEKYDNTALGKWISGEGLETRSLEDQALLEALPLNSEQRQCVLHGLNNPLTVITGPPGTGKSQVVTSLLINAAYEGKTVLFASKNNKAVDVVETRVNALGPRPVLLRLGAGEFQTRLTEYLISLLAASSSPHDESRYEESVEIHERLRERLERLDAELEETVRLRNQVDKLEQTVENIREEVGPRLFRSFKSVDLKEKSKLIEAFRKAVLSAQRAQQRLLTRCLWGLVKGKRYRKLLEATQDFRPIAQGLGISLPPGEPDDKRIGTWSAALTKLEKRIDAAKRVGAYFSGLRRLIKAKPLEQISRKRLKLIGELADVSESLWENWLKLQPKRLSQADRKLLREYSALLQMITSSQESSERLGSQVFRQYHSLFPKITNILSCWAVTSLSARGRVPFVPAFFDILIIDEASQCDIASALPLLYRSKHAVIIGDPKQLRHISALSNKQDRQLLAKHELVDSNAAWAYSVNALFDLGSGICRSEDIVDLLDHHRSHAEIIQFSNDHFYEGRLRIATNYGMLRRPTASAAAVRWIDVKGRVRRPATGGAYNQEEANRVVNEIQRLVLQQGYTGSVGVVSPFRAQANLIRELVYKQENLVARLAGLEFLADTVHRFQGDERDVMIFSPTISDGTTDGARIFLRNNPNLFNVAITRARAALIVVGDQEVAAQSGVEYLTRFAEYVMQVNGRPHPEKQDRCDYGPEYPPVARPELVSDWEKLLYRALYNAGLRPIPQYDVDKYILDFAVIDGDRKVNIEVDGERYHRNWDGELCWRDQIRNQRLIELGWDIIRFWVYQVRDELDGCVNRVLAWYNHGKLVETASPESGQYLSQVET